MNISNVNTILVDSQPDKCKQILSKLLSIFNIKKSHTVVIIKLHGVIGKVHSYKSGLNLDSLNTFIEKAFKIKKVTAICLTINSPGGSPVQSELIAARIINLSKKTKVPIYSFVEDVAASGGYWLACAGNEIYASSNSIIGSIGVVSGSFGFCEAMRKLGIERRIYSEGINKSIMDPFQPVKQEDVEIIKKLQKEIYENFTEYVKNRRAGKLTQNDDIIFNGAIWSAKTALDFGLIDGIQSIHEFINKKFGEDTKIIHINNKSPSFLQKFLCTITSHVIDYFENKIINKFNLN